MLRCVLKATKYEKKKIPYLVYRRFKGSDDIFDTKIHVKLAHVHQLVNCRERLL